MNNRRLRALIVRLQDRLSEDDRKRLHFFLGNDVPRRIRDDPSLGGTLGLMESLFDRDLINEDDFTFLINAFDEIQCLDAVRLLREHMKQTQSNGINDSIQSLSLVMPPLIDHLLNDQDDDKCVIKIPLINQEIFSNNNNIIINSNNNNINLETNTTDNQTKIVSPSTSKQSLITSLLTRGKYLILPSILLMILFGVVIGGLIWINQLNSRCKHLPKNQTTNNIIPNLYIKAFLLNVNNTLHRLENSLFDHNESSKKLKETKINYDELFKNLQTIIADLEDDTNYSEGTKCGCAKWCNERGSSYGVCGSGHTCICEPHPIEKHTVGEGCKCDGWCKRHNYKNGGICGDGYTCICTP